MKKISFLFFALALYACERISHNQGLPPGVDSTIIIDTLGATGTGDTIAQDSVDFTRPDTAIVVKAGLPYSRSKADSIVNFALKFLGAPYKATGCDPSGFDCSGFTYFVFKSFGMELPRSSIDMATSGRTIPFAEAQKADLIYFTGTDEEDRDVGHVGIVITERGRPLKFIHSSSNATEGGVKVTDYDSSNYDKRFLFVKRVL